MSDSYTLRDNMEDLIQKRKQLKKRLEQLPVMATGDATAMAQVRRQAEEAVARVKADAESVIGRLKSELDKKTEEVQSAIASRDKVIADLERKLAGANVPSPMRPLAFLLATRDGERTICPLYEGNNSFGRRRGRVMADGHQEIDISGDELQPRHFTITVDPAGGTLRLDDLIGDIEFEVFIK